jgi:MFS family permease
MTGTLADEPERRVDVAGGAEPAEPAGAAGTGSGPTADRSLLQRSGQAAVHYGWLPLLVLAATQVLETGERQSLAQAVDDLQDEFGMSDLAIAVIPFAMSIIGGFGAIPFGVLADRTRRTLLLGIAMLLWSASMLLTGFATGFAYLLAARLLVGAVEANGPAIVSLISDYYPARQRAKYMGLYSAGGLAGGLLGLVGGGIAVQLGGWRWAFWMWVPFGVLVAVWVATAPEPRRGQRDHEWDDARRDPVAQAASAAAGDAPLDVEVPSGDRHAPGVQGDAGADLARELGLAGVDGALGRLELPEPERVGTLDYASATPRAVYRELRRVRTMWLGLVALFVSQLLLVSLGFWAVEYFKRVHDLEAAAAGGLTALLGAGAVIGILSGGFLADRRMRQGAVNARIDVVAFGSIIGGIVLMPAFASTSLALTAPLFFLGGVFLTLPLAPGEAIVSDVVVGELRGRAAALRSFLRSFAAVGVLIVGALSEVLDLRWAMVAVCPAYVAGGLLVLLARRTYPKDLAFVAAEARRRQERFGIPPGAH